MIARPALVLCALCATLVAAGAQSAHSPLLGRPMRLVVPYVPGGGTDTQARLIAPALAAAVGQSVVIDNRAGGSSTIGTQIVARAVPDGQTIGISDAALVTNPSLLDNLPYDTLKDFAFIANISTSYMVLVVHPGLPAKTPKELIALARSQPGRLTYGTAGNGTATHLAGEQLRWVAQIDIQHVPYKGAGQSIAELLGGRISMAFTAQSTARPHVSAGRLRALAVTSPRRTLAMPEVPTFVESGVPQVDTQSMATLFAPAGVAPVLVTTLNTAVMNATAAGEIRERLLGLGYEPAVNTPAEAHARIRSEIEKWRAVIKAAGAKAQ